MKKCLLILFSMLLLSCKNNDSEIELLLKNCINEKVNEQIDCTNVEPIDYFEFIKKVENTIFKKQISSQNSKEEYISNINQIINISVKDNKELQEKLNILFEESCIYQTSAPLNLSILSCPIEILKKNKRNKTLILQMEMLDKLFISNLSESKKIFNDWIERVPKKDFNKIIYRSAIILTLSQYLSAKNEESNIQVN